MKFFHIRRPTFFSTYIVLLYFEVLNPFFSRFFKNVFHLPNVTSILKDVLLFSMFGFIVLRLRGLRLSRPNFIVLFSFVLFTLLYLGTSLTQGHVREGLYYYRAYLQILLFASVSLAVARTITGVKVDILINSLLTLNVISNICSIVFYCISLLSLSTYLDFIGYDQLKSTMTISGANLIRATIPAAGPNLLGLYLAISIVFLLIGMARDRFAGRQKVVAILLIITDIALLLLTFSRSAIVLIVATGAVLALVKLSIYLKTLIVSMMVILLLGAAGIIAIEKISGGRLETWVSLTLNMEDPSIGGHQNTYVEAWKNWKDYYIDGYEKGTVGPWAILFSEVMHNPENSTLVLLYDMGLLQFLILMVSYSVLAINTLRNAPQLALLIGLLVNLQFLPNVFAVEEIMFFTVIFIAFGRLQEVDNQRKNQSPIFSMT